MKAFTRAVAVAAAAAVSLTGCVPTPDSGSTTTAAPTMSSPAPVARATPVTIPDSLYPCKDPMPTSAGPTEAQIVAYQDVIRSGNTAPMSSHTCGTVEFLLGATECCGPMNKDDALSDWGRRLADHAGTPWTFSPDPALIAGWRAGPYAPFFPEGALIGLNSDGTVTSVAFHGDLVTFIYLGYIEYLTS